MHSVPSSIAAPRAFALAVTIVMLAAPVAAAAIPNALVLLVVAAALALLVPAAGRRGIVAGVRHHPLGAGIALAFAAWVALACVWAFDPATAAERMVRTVLLGLGGMALAAGAAMLDENAARRALRALLAGIALALAYGVVEHATDFVIYRTITGYEDEDPVNPARLNRGSTAVALLAFPMLAALVRGRADLILGLAGTAALAPLFVLAGSGAGTVAALAGTGVALLALAAPRAAPWLLGGVVVASVVAGPWLARGLGAVLQQAAGMPSSVAHRFHIWQFTGERVLERPWLGWGFDASRQIPNFGVIPMDGDRVIPLHPHNAILEIWLETGIVGVALAILMVLVAIRAVSRLPRRPASLLLGGIAAGFTIACSAFGIWQSMWIAVIVLAVAAGIAAATVAANRDQAARRR